MPNSSDISQHYTSGTLLDRLRAALRETGIDPDRPTIEALTPWTNSTGGASRRPKS